MAASVKLLISTACSPIGWF